MMMLPAPTVVWYYYVCHREVWLISRRLEPSQSNPFIEIGRLISDEAYSRERKEVVVQFPDQAGGMVIDLIKNEGDEVVVAEIKKSSSFEKAAKMQLAYYLMRLKMLGIVARGELLFPRERKKLSVTLTEEIEEELRRALLDIERIVKQDRAPKPRLTRFCRKCGYEELCWS